MVQFGWNAGPRHATVFGLAKSFRKKLSAAVMTSQDEDAIGALTLMWSILQVKMPSELMAEVGTRLEQEGLPRIATRNVAEGDFFYYILWLQLTYITQVLDTRW